MEKKRKKKNKKECVFKRSGFSMVELLIVLVIVGIILGMTGFAFSRVFRKENPKSIALRINQRIKLWRETAVINKLDCNITLSGDTIVCIFSDGTVERLPLSPFTPGGIGVGSGLPEAQYNFDPDGIIFRGWSGSWGDTLYFTKTGEATPGAIYFTRSNEDNYAIGVTASGRVKLWKWGGGWYEP
jgi:prepilin-type N-terminal cleavage/methylation domain-containing protein